MRKREVCTCGDFLGHGPQQQVAGTESHQPMQAPVIAAQGRPLPTPSGFLSPLPALFEDTKIDIGDFIDPRLDQSPTVAENGGMHRSKNTHDAGVIGTAALDYVTHHSRPVLSAEEKELSSRYPFVDSAQRMGLAPIVDQQLNRLDSVSFGWVNRGEFMTYHRVLNGRFDGRRYQGPWDALEAGALKPLHPNLLYEDYCPLGVIEGAPTPLPRGVVPVKINRTV
jgi:hypothetical protein